MIHWKLLLHLFQLFHTTTSTLLMLVSSRVVLAHQWPLHRGGWQRPLNWRPNSSSNCNMSSNSSKFRVFLGVGSNMGNRFQNIQTGLQLLCHEKQNETTTSGGWIRLKRTSFLHQTAPMYVQDQPAFLNGAVELETNLEPPALLQRIKQVEQEMGRNFTEVRNGPRPLDLDILLYDRYKGRTHDDEKDTMEENAWQPVLFETANLTVPHPLMGERGFVLQPLNEVAGTNYRHPRSNSTLSEMQAALSSEEDSSGDDNDNMVRVLPLPRDRVISFNQTIIMGILNVTPDSFSDGGKWNASINTAVDHAVEMERQGACIVDIGGESTRPGADVVSIEEEIQRTIPVILRIREVSDIAISIDTRNAKVARAAIEAGADIVNDVSGGCHDENMLSTVMELGVPMVLMHMRGTPQTMQSLTSYEDVVQDVAQTLLERIRVAEKAGIPRWLLMVDPGIGFAKDLTGNLKLLKNLNTIRSVATNVPILLGTSRKGFIGKLSGQEQPENRDFGTVASMVASLCLEGHGSECTFLRVHNVAAAFQAVKVMDAIKKV